MYLNGKQILFLAIPFIVALLFSLFSDSLTSYAKDFFPAYSEYTNKTLDKKATIYLNIEKNDAQYKYIMKAIKERKEFASWMAKDVLYGKIAPKPKKDLYFINQPQMKKEVIVYEWKLQAIFPTQKVAIINGKIVHLGDEVDHGKVIEIQNNKVLIQYKKGQKWVHIFQ